MVTDIVKYLRLSRTRFNRHAEAADEIERLRANVKMWSNWAIDYACDDEECECDRCVMVRNAWEQGKK